MSDNPDGAALAPSTARVLAALTTLGPSTAAQVAQAAGLGYSTTTPKLRALHEAGLAVRVRGGEGRSLWQPAGSADGPTAAEAAGDTGGGDTSPRAAPAPTHAEPDTMSPTGVDTPDPHPDGGADAAPPHTDAELATAVPASQIDTEPPPPLPADTPGQVAGTAEVVGEAGRTARRTQGSLRGAVLDVLEANPGRQYRTAQLCKLIDAAADDADAAKASAGAVHNAAITLVAAGKAVQTVERPATFALAPPGT